MNTSTVPKGASINNATTLSTPPLAIDARPPNASDMSLNPERASG